MADTQPMLFEDWMPIPSAEKCGSCRKRRRMEGRGQCEICYYGCCLVGRSDGLSPAWSLRAKNSIMGMRIRAAAIGVDASEVASTIEARKLIIAQEYRCAATGVLLEPDNSCVLGHKHAVQNGGSFQIINLFWITWEVNRVMATGSFDELKSFCGSVVSWSELFNEKFAAVGIQDGG